MSITWILLSILCLLVGWFVWEVRRVRQIGNQVIRDGKVLQRMLAQAHHLEIVDLREEDQEC